MPITENPITLTSIDIQDTGQAELVQFLTGNTFPFHVNDRPESASVHESIDAGAFDDEDHQSFWVDHADLGRIGFVRLEDLTDPTPLFDLRLAEQFRGRGLGVPVLRALTHMVFTRMDAVERFEGQTREDNIAMRKTFLRCGWLKEAHYREAWPTGDGGSVASVAYAILRRDWESGTTTTFEWEDLTDS